MTDLPTSEYELFKLLIDEIQKNNKDNTSKYSTLEVILIVMFGLIICQKVYKYGHKAYKHHSALNSRHNSSGSESN